MPQVGLFGFDSNNLGDEMQSLAVLAHLASVDTFVDRDRMPDFPGNEETLVVFNSWFMQGEDFRIPAPHISPLWHGFSAGRPELLAGKWARYLRKSMPIGCRDADSCRLLQNNGIDAYFTGCLTLFIGRAMDRPAGPKSGIVFVDVPPEAEPHIPPSIVERAVRLTTFPGEHDMRDTLARWANVGRLIQILANADLVVTRRLHAAMPSASFGVPVVAIPDPRHADARFRYSGMDGIIPTVYLEDAATQLPRLNWANIPLANIPADVEQRYAGFRDQLRQKEILAEGRPSNPVLDRVGEQKVELRISRKYAGTGEIRLRLGHQTFPLSVLLWTDRSILVTIPTFPGFSKFRFRVESNPWKQNDWRDEGLLVDLAGSPVSGVV